VKGFFQALLPIFFLLIPAPLPAFEIQSAQLQIGPPERSAFLDRPVTIKDPSVIYRIDWRGLKAGVPYEYRWHDPLGNLVRTYTNSRDKDSNGGGWGQLSTQKLWEGGPGRWTVEFYYGEEIFASDSFIFTSPEKIEYLGWTPQNPRALLVAVHSSSFNPLQYYHGFLPLAKELGLALMAPYFPQDQFHYQRVFLQGRADLQLQAWIEDFLRDSGLPPDFPLLFYGHSAGAQFSHRYLLAHPQGTIGAVFSAPGYWTLFTKEETFPYGLAAHQNTPPGLVLQPRAFLSIPSLVISGVGDVLRTANLNQSEAADRQGRHRVERAQTWVDSVREYCRIWGLPQKVEHFIAPQAGHNDLRSKTLGEIRAFFRRVLDEELN
jgi:pimeloyl-ACP methyl ester carboxylesterase